MQSRIGTGKGKAISVVYELEFRRRELDMTVAALARRSGVSRTTVNRVLSGKSAKLISVLLIAHALGMRMTME